MMPFGRTERRKRLVRACALLVATSAAGYATKASACSLCGCGDPLLAVADPAAVAGILRVQLDAEHAAMTAGNDSRSGYTDRLSQWSYRLNLAYRPAARVSLLAVVPVVDKIIRTEGGGADALTSHTQGLGDVQVAGRLSLWRDVSFARRRVHELAVSAGTVVPTGAHDAAATDASGAVAPVDPHGQVGTGAWGPFAGLHYRFEQADWLGFADVSYRTQTEASYFDGSRYRFGDAALFGVHGQFHPWSRLVADLGLDGRYARPDHARLANAPTSKNVANTGGTVLAISPGLYVNAMAGLWAFVRVQLPAYVRLYGQQEVGTTAVVGLQYEAL